METGQQSASGIAVLVLVVVEEQAVLVPVGEAEGLAVGERLRSLGQKPHRRE